MTWLDRANLPNSADLLDGRINWKHNPKRLDVTMAVFSSAVGVCIGTKGDLRAPRADAMWKLLAQAADSSPDVLIQPAKVMVDNGLLTRAVPVLTKLATILKAADIDLTKQAA
jgi:hypothetical protein